MSKQFFIAVLAGLVATLAMAQSSFEAKAASRLPTDVIVNCWIFSNYLQSSREQEVKKMGGELEELYKPIAFAKFGGESGFLSYAQENINAFKYKAKVFQDMQAPGISDFYVYCLTKMSDAYLSVK
jgi:hypothetical protein